MTEDNWQQARLIPTSGISGPDEAERRATSALLAVMGSVREFGTANIRGLGAPGGQLGTFIEVPFKAGERTIYPDGVLQTSRGGRTWTCLVEVKTGASELERPQVEAYLDVARENGFRTPPRAEARHRGPLGDIPLSQERSTGGRAFLAATRGHSLPAAASLLPLPARSQSTSTLLHFAASPDAGPRPPPLGRRRRTPVRTTRADG